MTDTPETDGAERESIAAYIEEYGPDAVFPCDGYDHARKLEREREDLQKAVNGLCEHIGVSPANTTLLAVQVLRIERERDEARTTIEDAKRALNATAYEGILLAAMRVKEERDEWKAEAKRWRDMYMQFDEMLESDIKDATKKVSDIIAQIEKLSKKINKGY